jgi:hypothetical protein
MLLVSFGELWWFLFALTFNFICAKHDVKRFIKPKLRSKIMSTFEGVNEIDYKGCTIKTMENSSGSWDWKIDTNYTSLTIITDSGSTSSENAAIKQAKEEIDNAVRSAW